MFPSPWSSFRGLSSVVYLAFIVVMILSLIEQQNNNSFAFSSNSRFQLWYWWAQCFPFPIPRPVKEEVVGHINRDITERPFPAGVYVLPHLNFQKLIYSSHGPVPPYKPLWIRFREVACGSHPKYTRPAVPHGYIYVALDSMQPSITTIILDNLSRL